MITQESKESNEYGSFGRGDDSKVRQAIASVSSN